MNSRDEVATVVTEVTVVTVPKGTMAQVTGTGHEFEKSRL
jgi:hypothetical protein